jgi:hypothetical protein
MVSPKLATMIARRVQYAKDDDGGAFDAIENFIWKPPDQYAPNISMIEWMLFGKVPQLMY